MLKGTSKGMSTVKGELDEKVIIFTLKEKIGIGVFILFALASPLIFKRTEWFSWMGLGKSAAEIGDAIGGISAPFIGVLAAYFVYKSFEAQVRANKEQFSLIAKSHKDQMNIITQELNYNYITNLTEEILNSFEALKIRYKTQVFEGKQIFEIMDTVARYVKYFTSVNKTNREEYLESQETYIEGLNVISTFLKNLMLIKGQITESGLPKEFKIVKYNHIRSFVEMNIKYDLNKTFNEYGGFFSPIMAEQYSNIELQLNFIDSGII